ncbi:MAG: signal peptidase I [Defluviitaleaceae bacterium]|nr:signal peptidase I [Defluviitaleaceae bacterium]
MLSIFFAMFVNNFVIVNAQVLSGSMEGTIMTDNRVLGLRFGFASGLRRGDIIVFDSPIPEMITEPFIKRVIALGGEKIKVYGGITHINGRPMLENYVTSGVQRDFESVFVPYGYVFVMGDNRNNSKDSRCFGVIHVDTVVGRIFIY